MEALQTALVAAAQTVADGGINAITAILPVAAPVMAALVCIGVAIKTIRKFTGR